MNAFFTVSFLSLSVAVNAALAQTSVREVPGSLVIATRMEEECLFAPDMERPPSLIDNAIASIEVDDEPGPSEIKNGIGAALVVKLIDFGIDKLDTYIDNAAKDRVASYTLRHPTTLHQLEASTADGDEKTRYDVRLNPALRCLTIVGHTKPITYEEPSNPTKSGLEKAKVQSYRTLLKNGFKFDPTSSPSFIFETALIVSQDATAARLHPTFLKIVSFDDGKGNAETDTERNVAVTFSLTKVEGSTSVFRDTIDFGNLKVKDSLLSINGAFQRNYYDHNALKSHVPRPPWRSLSGVRFEIDPKKNTLVKAIKDGVMKGDVITATPLNFTIEMTVTEEASEIAKFLSDFAKEQELTSLVRNQLVDDLGLRSEEEIEEALKNELKSRKSLVETYRDAYRGRYADTDPKPQDYDENLEEYEDEIERLDLLLLEIDGPDPLGILASSE